MAGITFENGGQLESCVSFCFGFLFGGANGWIFTENAVWPNGPLDLFHRIDDVRFNKVLAHLIPNNSKISAEKLDLPFDSSTEKAFDCVDERFPRPIIPMMEVEEFNHHIKNGNCDGCEFRILARLAS